MPLSGEEFQGDNDLPCPVSERGQADKDAKAAMVLDNSEDPMTPKKKKKSISTGTVEWSQVTAGWEWEEGEAREQGV